VTELLKQAQYSPLPISLMAATLFAVNKGYPGRHRSQAGACTLNTACTRTSKTSTLRLLAKLEAAKAMDKDAEAELSAALAAFKKNFRVNLALTSQGASDGSR
jgi:F-type H+-transporting ATPase subunit alpha